MANRYWVGGTASWDATAGTKWATTSGGAGGSAVPTAADDVFLDASSGAVTVTVSGTRVCRSFTCTGFTGTLTGTSTPVLTIGDASGGAMTLVSGMTVTTMPLVNFVSTSNNGGAGWGITTAGKTVQGMTFDGVGGKWVFQDAVFSGGSLTLTNGTLDSNSQTLRFYSVSSNNSNTRSLTLGSSSVTVSGNLGGTVWNFATTTGLTFSGASSTIILIFSAATRTFAGGGLTYGTLTNTTTHSTATTIITGANTFNTVNFGSGRALQFTAGTTTTATTWNLSGSKYGYQRFTGLASNGNATAPDSAPLSITSDITILTRVAAETYGTGTVQAIVSKNVTTGNQRGYRFAINGVGNLTFSASSDGVTATTATSTVSTNTIFSATETAWLLTSWRASDGRVQFYTASGALTNPAASDFTQLGADGTAAVGSIFDNTQSLEIGTTENSTLQPFWGSVYRVKIYNGVFSTAAFGGTLQFDADFTTKTFGANSFTESSANGATVSISSGVQVGDGRLDIASATAATHTLSQSSGVVSGNYLTLTNSIAQGGASWYAGGYSSDLGGNSGWIFSGYGAGNFFEMF